jgi:hypothetical protein
MTIDYQILENQARTELEPVLDRLKGLGLVLSMFFVSEEVGKELQSGLSGMGTWAKYAATRTMVIEYAKPFGRNDEPAVKRLMLHQSFLDPVTSKPLHAALLDNRNKAAAHLDTNAQLFGVGLIGAEAENEHMSANRFEKLRIPMTVRTDVAIAVNMTDKGEIQQVLDHVKHARELTEQEIRRTAEDVRDTALDHSPVLDRLSDIVTFTSAIPTGGNSYQMQATGRAASPITSQRSQSSTISGMAFLEAVLVSELTPSVEMQVKGNGFRLSSRQTGPRNVEFSATFLDFRPPTAP